MSIYMPCDGLMKISDYLCMILACAVLWLYSNIVYAAYRIFCIQNYPLGFYVWGYAPYTPSTANQLKCSSLCSIISLDSWFRLLIPYSQLTLALWNNNPDDYLSMKNRYLRWAGTWCATGSCNVHCQRPSNMPCELKLYISSNDFLANSYRGI